MKRFFLYLSVYMFFLCMPIKAEDRKLHYRIYTSEYSLKEIKTQVLEILDTLCEGVDSVSYTTIVEENLEDFKKIKEVKVKLKKDTLYIYAGTGKKKHLDGTYEKAKTCLPEVKAKSLIYEWMKGED